MPFVRHCVECPKCHTRYLIGFSPYRNGASLVRIGARLSDEYVLYCSCSNPAVSSRWHGDQIKKYQVSKAAHSRRYGTPEEIRAVTHRSNNLPLVERLRYTSKVMTRF